MSTRCPVSDLRCRELAVSLSTVKTHTASRADSKSLDKFRRTPEHRAPQPGHELEAHLHAPNPTTKASARYVTGALRGNLRTKV